MSTNSPMVDKTVPITPIFNAVCGECCLTEFDFPSNTQLPRCAGMGLNLALWSLPGSIAGALVGGWQVHGDPAWAVPPHASFHILVWCGPPRNRYSAIPPYPINANGHRPASLGYPVQPVSGPPARSAAVGQPGAYPQGWLSAILRGNFEAYTLDQRATATPPL